MLLKSNWLQWAPKLIGLLNFSCISNLHYTKRYQIGSTNISRLISRLTIDIKRANTCCSIKASTKSTNLGFVWTILTCLKKRALINGINGQLICFLAHNIGRTRSSNNWKSFLKASILLSISMRFAQVQPIAFKWTLSDLCLFCSKPALNWLDID